MKAYSMVAAFILSTLLVGCASDLASIKCTSVGKQNSSYEKKFCTRKDS